MLMEVSLADWVVTSEVLRNFAIVGAAVVGLGLAWWRTSALNRQAAASAAQVAVSRREHAAEVFSRAVGQLGSDRLEIRVGAIHSLTALSRDFPELRQPVFEVLAAYARTRPDALESESLDIDLSAIMKFVRPVLEEK